MKPDSDQNESLREEGTPEGPRQPGQPGQPGQPEQPGQPGQPGQPEQPGQPGQAVDPHPSPADAAPAGTPGLHEAERSPTNAAQTSRQKKQKNDAMPDVKKPEENASQTHSESSRGASSGAAPGRQRQNGRRPLGPSGHKDRRKGAPPPPRQGGGLSSHERFSFSFNGKTLWAQKGDSLASALLAHGLWVHGRSFKYHRRRGLIAMDWHEPNSLAQVGQAGDETPNRPTPLVELEPGLISASQNHVPALRWDWRRLFDYLSPFLRAGFYYKTFKGPGRHAWTRLYEPFIRKSAGLGRASYLQDPRSYDHAFAFCDYLVIGGGPAGLWAALELARAGHETLLVEKDWILGGSWADQPDRAQELATLRAQLRACPKLRVQTRTVCFGQYDQGFGAVETLPPAVRAQHHVREIFWQIHPRRVLLASGACEKMLCFPGNDTAGVMLLSAAERLMGRYGVTLASKAVLMGDSSTLRPTAARLRALGLSLEAHLFCDPVQEPLPGVPTSPTWTVLDVKKKRGRLHAIRIGESGAPLSTTKWIQTELLLVSGGWQPQGQLATHLGHAAVWNGLAHSWVPALSETFLAVGAARGVHDPTRLREDVQHLVKNLEPLEPLEPQDPLEPPGDAARRSWRENLAAPCRQPVLPEALAMARPRPGRPVPRWPDLYYRLRRPKAFTDFQNDVTSTDIRQALLENFQHPEHLKRYTTLGMGTDQGRLAQNLGLTAAARHLQRPVRDLHPPRARPPLAPISLGVLGGLPMRHPPTRQTPIHAWHAAHGASFVEAGLWVRPQWYTHPSDETGAEAGTEAASPTGGTTGTSPADRNQAKNQESPRLNGNGHARRPDWRIACDREVQAVRHQAGLCDISTLGKIELYGPDARTFLEYVYVNSLAKLAPGRARYGVMLREDGIVLDDGVCACLGPDHFYITTTTANAAKVFQHLTYCHQVLWPNLRLFFVSVTEPWAKLALAGPKARQILSKAWPHLNLSNEALPHMGLLQTSLDSETPGRLFRLSFSGERAYEIAVPARRGQAVWEHLMAKGQSLGLQPYGTEAMGVLRIEKGHVAGPELNGRTTCQDLGLEKLMAKHKDYAGKVPAQRPAFLEARRPQLVGLRPVHAGNTGPFRAGGLLFSNRDPGVCRGWVSSACFSPTLGQSLGLGFVENGRQCLTEILTFRDDLRQTACQVQITPPCHYDPDHRRLYDRGPS